MRSTIFVALVALSLLPATTFAQTGPQTAAVESAAPAPSAPTGSGGITRDQFIQRAKDRAAERAAARFDQMDADHDGVLDRAEMRAWRSQHPRRAAVQQSQPTPQ
jgi:Ca2+-binding EF-hand superfamily protein